ncbi:organoarsenical effux MFS transporter ArsJ [Colwellia psychrerythraea]|uniref:Major facilitator superfamily MFS_1 n=1 Tax=Colwellia psychrerythraea TaxID=28229 RepID=A0A099KGB3_COLPS|nr:organoarsenical effux MFS transporter ArsJ [Colwellia psychrerythraea]KGJ89037.1 major facilitator superfamily MFS_1 [Colwellia psychrerythraea]
MFSINILSQPVKKYLAITANYWAFTLTDGALRMLVLLYFYQLGYSPFALATLFVLYEVFGVITNLVGGWFGARIGLNKTMCIGIVIQVLALIMLAVPSEYLSVAYVMSAQALSGIAKDLNKMSAKSSIKLLVGNLNNKQAQSRLFTWVALLTGSKNTLKGIGFFLGGVLLTTFDFQVAVLLMASALAIVAISTYPLLRGDIGKASYKAKFSQLFSNDASLNYLSAARLCLFAGRDVWFVIALPVYLASQLQWQHQSVGALLACWIIFYGIIQANTPKLLSLFKSKVDKTSQEQTTLWSLILAVQTLLLCLAIYLFPYNNTVLIFGLFIFATIFAINSSLHSYLIVAIAREDGVSMDVGFYYMANAMGRLIGTVLSGLIYQHIGLLACMSFAFIFIILASYFVRKIA